MPTEAPKPWTAARELLNADPSLSASVVVEKLAARGLKTTPESILTLKKRIRQKAAKSGAVPVPAAASATTKPTAKSPAVGLDATLANVALVDKVAGLSGGVGNARQVAEAVRACGGVDEFLKVLDLLAGVKKVK
jgi:hypothetical protein